MTEAIESVQGRLVAYRVLEIGPRYTDREGRSHEHVTPADGAGGRLVATFGDPPKALLHSLSNAIPLVDGPPGMRDATKHQTLPEIDRDGADLTLKTPEFVEPGATYLTLAYVRDDVVDGIPSRWARWVADASSVLDLINGFAEEAAAVLDRGCARLVAGGNPVNRVVYATRTVFFEPEDGTHMPVVRSSVNVTASGHVAADGWDALDPTPVFEALEDAVASDSWGQMVATSSWWYFQALDEPDLLRRFLFAYWGLEVLAAKFCKANRDGLTSRIVSDYGLPAKSLLWPTPEGSDRPARNAEFRFALMAWAVRGADAQADIDQFRRLADIRNKLSHGDRLEHASLPPHEGVLLLRQYLELTAAFDPAGPAL